MRAVIGLCDISIPYLRTKRFIVTQQLLLQVASRKENQPISRSLPRSTPPNALRIRVASCPVACLVTSSRQDSDEQVRRLFDMLLVGDKRSGYLDIAEQAV